MTIINILSQTYALYCLFIFYHVTKNELAHIQTFLKFFCIKVVIFFSWWQSLFISYLVYKQYIVGNKLDAAESVAHDLEKLLVTFEMFLFAIMFVVGFPVYDFSGAIQNIIVPVDQSHSEISICSNSIRKESLLYFYCSTLYHIMMCVPTFVKLHPKLYKSNNNLLGLVDDVETRPENSCSSNSVKSVPMDQIDSLFEPTDSGHNQESTSKLYNIYYSALVLLDSGFVSSTFNPMQSKKKSRLSENIRMSEVCSIGLADHLVSDDIEKVNRPASLDGLEAVGAERRNMSLFNAILITSIPTELTADIIKLGNAVRNWCCCLT